MGLVAHLWYMARQATETLHVTPETKRLVLERKPDGMTQDLWVRKQLGVADE
jgi:hypothetical protein